MLYLAYGSNLNVEQMMHRCPGAQIVGKGVLKDWRLVFRVHATIEPSKGSVVPFAVWDITDEDEARLDRYEGYPRYYVKRMLSVAFTDWANGSIVKSKAMAYIMTEGRQVSVPSGSYYQIICDGYDWFGLDRDILKNALLSAQNETEA